MALGFDSQFEMLSPAFMRTLHNRSTFRKCLFQQINGSFLYQELLCVIVTCALFRPAPG